MLAEVKHKIATLESQYEEEHALVLKLHIEVETSKKEEKKYSTF